jgi:hypothetical protein
VIKKEEKRGSHVEIIISFIIFVTFIVFLLSILIPAVTTNKDKENTFSDVEIKVMNKVSSNLTSITVNLDSGDDCVNLPDLMGDLGIGENIIVKDYYGENVEAYSDGDSLQINPESAEDTFFKIYYSEEFDEIGTDSGCSEHDYTLGLTKTEKYVFEKKVIDLINEDYGALRTEFKIPESLEFGYGIVLSNGTIYATNIHDVTTNVYVKDTPIEYVDTEGNIREGYLRTRIW